MRLFIDLVKAVDQGIVRDKASYAARIQIGIEKDGSPLYRYFKTQESYDAWKKKHGKEAAKDDKKDDDKSKKKDTIKDVVDKEHKESVKKIKSKAAETKQKFEEKTTKKSLRIFIDE